MNLIFGTLGRGAARNFQLLSSTVEELYGLRPEPVDSARSEGLAADTHQSECTASLAVLGDGGVVAGRASDGDTSLVLLGGLHHPIPGWVAGRPPDDPNIAANWLLRRYQERGDAFLDGVLGQFCVLIASDGGRRLVAASDPGGLRGLFIKREGEDVTIASNMFLLARALRETTEVDRSLEDFFLIYGFLPGARTIFKGVETLNAGVVDVSEKGSSRKRPIATGDPWADRFPPLDPRQASEPEVMNRLYDAFMTATEEQTASAPEAGVLLGGVDSALVASALHRLGKEVRTYSFHYEEPGFDQPHTDTLSRFLGSRHHWIRITPDDVGQGLEEYGLTFSRPTNWPNYVIQTARLCAVMREHGVLHIHSGDGADHTFMGYPRTHTLVRLYQTAPKLPELAGRAITGVVARPWLEDLLGRPFRVGLNVVRNLSRPMPQRGFLSFRIFDESSLKRLRAAEPPRQEKGIEEMLESLTSGLKDLTPARLGYLGKAGVSANRSKLGGSSDATGVIVYAPYLHPGLKRLAEALPDHLLRPKGGKDSGGTGKYVLLRMAEEKKLLPREIIYQKKVAAVDAPVDDWYAGPLNARLLSVLQHLPFETQQDYLRTLTMPTAVSRFYARRLSSDRLTSHEVSLLATYAGLARALA